MDLTDLEKTILEKLSSGQLDGVVGNDLITGDHAKVTIRTVIINGIPQILRFGPDHKYFDGKENIHVDGKKTIQLFETVADKLKFLQKFGWLLSDSDVKKYSAMYKPKK
ncbi:MAG: hypothetical protein IJ189_13270 [Clostridia bacterium]|nr:hypothetical protein [Clostridia bacterium]